jgi:Alpha/beta hydrolase of unknown function (DUF900)
MAFFSWPSQGTLGGYMADAATIEASEQDITNFMIDFVTHSGAEAVHIIAYSMGNRGVLRAVNRIAERAQQRSGVPFGQVILAAADVDSDTFRRLCGAPCERREYFRPSKAGAIVGSVHREPCADKQRVRGRTAPPAPTTSVVPLIRCADLRCTQVIEARFAPDGQSVRSQPLPQIRYLVLDHLVLTLSSRPSILEPRR